ncbi:MAG: c-type cytochrome [Verrucomicrobia bacterium]|nr:c-type cytochrome [Verrucomicrobiota bacterium]
MKLSVPLLVVALAATLPVPARAAQIQVGAHHFTVPDGFTIERVATTDLAPRPVSASFDDKGRLYVTDSSGSNEKPSEQLKNPKARILRLEDTDGDGVFDKSVVFADKVMFPQGCLWHDGSVYAAGPPSIWKFTDTDGDGLADKREEWFKGGTLTGCANDIHGPYLGPDGYIYWTKGAFDEQTHTLGNGRVLKDRAAHIYRAKPDGSDLDVVMTGGMDNPVGVAFTAEGEVVFTSTFIDFSQPGRRDGIGHASYGAVFGKENSALDDGRVKRTSPELAHPFVQFGAGAPSGLCRYRGTELGAEYRDNLFATLFNLRKVTRHQLRISGASYASTDSDFVVSDNMDFHPTDVLEDADGSLLIVDTGGWYKLCCPSSQIAKGDVLGGIYRVRKTNAPKPAGTELATRRQRLAAAPGMSDFAFNVILRRAIWKNQSSNVGWFREILSKNTGGNNPASPSLARLTAEGLGKLRDRGSVGLLLAAAETDDVALAQAAVAALIDIAAPDHIRAEMVKVGTRGQRAALIALSQIDGSQLKAGEVVPHLVSSDAELRRAASWIAGRHPEWAETLAGFFGERLLKKDLSDSERSDLQRQLAAFAKSSAVQQILAATLTNSAAASSSRLDVMRAMGQAGLKETPAAWLAGVVGVLKSGDEALKRQAVTTVRSLALPKDGNTGLATALIHVARDVKAPTEVRLEALSAVPGGVSLADGVLFEFALKNLDPALPVNTRSAAASVLVKAKLTAEQRLALADAMKSVSPLEMTRLLAAFEKASDEQLGLRLVEALKQAKSAGMRADLVKTAIAGFPVAVQERAAELLNRLNADAGKQKAHLESLLTEVHGKGDIRRGQAIFNSAKAACSACHAIGYQGGKVGPDLTRISEIRSERDLLEAIVYPSASFVRSYEPMIVAMKDGEEHSGVLRREDGSEVLLATGPTSEMRIARADIVEMRPGAVSVMPQGLDEQLSREELADLLAFLRNTKWGAQ